MEVKRFLQWGGWLLVAVGVVGYLLGNKLSAWSFSEMESSLYLVIGLVMLATAYWGQTSSFVKAISVLVGIVGLYLAAYGQFVSVNFYGLASLEGVDRLIWLVVGVMGLWSVWGKKK